MMISRRAQRIFAVIAALAAFHAGAGAMVLPIDVQVQTQYQITEIKQEGEAKESNGAFTTTYNLGFRRPLTPHVKLQSFFTLNSSDRADQIGQQSNRNMVFNLLSQERTYTLNGGIDRSDNSSARSSLGASTFSNSSTSNYHVNFVWSEPALPVVNLQYRRSLSDVSSGLNNSTYSTGTWLTGAYYEYNPLRFTFDRQEQSYQFSGRNNSTNSNTVRNRYGVNFEQRLLGGLNFSADLSKDTNSTNSTNGVSSQLGGSSSVFRLTAIPTRSVLVSADKSFYSSHLASRSFNTDSDSDTTTLSLRSEVLPGLSFGVTKLTSNQTSGLVRSKNDNLSINLNAALTTDTIGTIGWNKSKFDSPTEESSTRQSNSFMSLRTPLGFDTDMNLDFGLTDSISGADNGFRGRYAGINVRNRSTMDMSLGLGYRWNELDLTRTTGGKQRTQSVDFDISWTPASRIGINGRASYFVTSGNTISQYISPTFDLRWEPSSQSTLVLRYDFNRSRQWDPLLADILGQSAKGISGRFTYRLNRRSTFDLTYDYQAASASGIDFQRAIRMYFRTRL